jgi:HD-GYP domain-containing protein (c-di-GMP phosphodiesterase class II)
MPEVTLIYHTNHVTPETFGVDANATPKTITRWIPAQELFTDPPVDEPAVLLADESLVAQASDIFESPVHVVVATLDAASAEALGRRADLSMVELHDTATRLSLLDAACRLASSQSTIARLNEMLARKDHEFREMSRIGMALMHEHDRTALLHLILEQGKQLTESDGAGLLFVETRANGAPELVPVMYDFDSLPDLGVPTIRYPIDDNSTVGHTARIKKPVVAADLHRLPADAQFTGSSEFERRYRYYAKSILSVPLLDQNGGVMGVIFFINRKSNRNAIVRTKAQVDRYCLTYTEREVRLARSLASQAALSIETTRLYAQIEGLLESMVKAAVSAIDERDPATAGHSLRVAALTTALAEEITRSNRGPYRDVQFTPPQLRELRFAALLHDLGKVTVREDVLLKANKLPAALWERVNARFDLIRRTMELEYAERHEQLCRTAPDDSRGIERLDAELEGRLDELQRFREVIRRANEPTVLVEPVADGLQEIAARTFRDANGNIVPYLTPEEMHYLQITRGSLDEEERAEVESHVTHTRRFLSQIPWTSDLKNLVKYACDHHEKLDGSGYPRGLRDAEIPLETRMIQLADMFDALTESDRPYKRAVPPEEALEIIQAEADAGLLDRDLVHIMAETQVYRQVLDQDWRTL